MFGPSGVIQNYHHFHENMQSMLGGGDQRLPYAFKMLTIMHCIFIRGRQNQHLQSTLEGGRGGHKKSTLYAFDSVGNYGRPLTHMTYDQFRVRSHTKFREFK